MTNIVPKLNERATLEAIKERDEKQNARLKEINDQKDQAGRIQDLKKTVAQLEVDKEEKELQCQEIDLSGDIDELDTKLDI